MRSAIHSLLVLLFTAWAAPGCTDEASSPSPAALQAAEQPLQEQGVHYLAATGTAENPVFTFYDQDKVRIGDGQISQNPQRADIQWRGNSWERTDGAFSTNAVAVGSAGADAAELDTALTVFELSLDQVFPPDSSSLNDQVQANVCVVGTACRRPDFRCSGACTGYVCSSTVPGVWGVCDPPR